MTAAAILLGVIVICSGGSLVWIAVISWQGGLQRNNLAGVRTPSTMRSDEAFAVANKAAAPYAAAGGGVMIVGGALTLVVPRHDFGAPLFGGIIIGLVMILVGAVIGVRACK